MEFEGRGYMQHMTQGTAFYKLTGSGNDFVFFDARTGNGSAALESADRIREVCARGTGVGADGAVFLVPSKIADVGIRYYNSDGSHASLCGNATLCTVRLAQELGIEPRVSRRRDDKRELKIETDSGVVAARMLPDGEPEFDLGVVDIVNPDVPIGHIAGERTIGFALAGIPHLVVHVEDLEAVNVGGHGKTLRSDPSLGPDGANVNFVGVM